MINLIGISGKMGNGKDTVADIIQYCTRDFAYSDYTLEQFQNLNTTKTFEIKYFAFKLKQISSMLIGLPIETFKTQEGKLTVLDEMWDYYTLEYFEEGLIKNLKFNSYEEAVKFIKFNFQIIVRDSFISKIQHKKMTVREVLQLVGTECMRNNLHQNVWVNSLFADYTEGSRWLITDTRFPNEAKAIKERGGIILRVNRDLESNTNTHPSETSLDNYEFDYVINNNGTIEELIEEVIKFLDHYNI